MHREFLKVVGIPPKHDAKIVQVNAVVGALQAGDDQELSNLALEHGYFDQSHFIRDFKRFVGASPTVFLLWRHQGRRQTSGRARRARGTANEGKNEIRGVPEVLSQRVTLRAGTVDPAATLSRIPSPTFYRRAG